MIRWLKKEWRNLLVAAVLIWWFWHEDQKEKQKQPVSGPDDKGFMMP